MYKKYCLIASILLIIPFFTTSMKVEKKEEKKKVEQIKQQEIPNLVKKLQDPDELNTWLKEGKDKLLGKEFLGPMKDQLIHNIRPTPQYLHKKKLKPFRVITGDKKIVHSLAFSTDGTKFVSGSEDKTIKLWDVETGNKIHTFTGHGIKMRMDIIVGTIYSLAFSPDNTKLASGSEDKTIKLWDV